MMSTCPHVVEPIRHRQQVNMCRHSTEDLSQATFIFGALILLAVGWFTFLRRPDVPSAHALLLLCTAFGATVISGLLPDGLSVQYDRIAYWTTSFFSYAIFGTLLAPWDGPGERGCEVSPGTDPDRPAPIRRTRTPG